MVWVRSIASSPPDELVFIIVPLSTTQSKTEQALDTYDVREGQKKRHVSPYSVAFPSKKVAFERMRELSLKVCYGIIG